MGGSYKGGVCVFFHSPSSWNGGQILNNMEAYARNDTTVERGRKISVRQDGVDEFQFHTIFSPGNFAQKNKVNVIVNFRFNPKV